MKILEDNWNRNSRELKDFKIIRTCESCKSLIEVSGEDLLKNVYNDRSFFHWECCCCETPKYKCLNTIYRKELPNWVKQILEGY